MANFLHGRAPTLQPSKLSLFKISTHPHLDVLYLDISICTYDIYSTSDMLINWNMTSRLDWLILGHSVFSYEYQPCREILPWPWKYLEHFFSSEFSNFQNWIWNCMALYCNTWTCLEAFEFMFQKVWQVGHSFSFLELYVCVSEAFRLIVLCRNF